MIKLMPGELLALKTALDGYQRFEANPEVGPYFYKIIRHLVGGVDELNVWAIRDALNNEDDRRSRHIMVVPITSDASQQLARLSKQERTVLKLISEGHRLETVAELLSISQRTLINHRTRICQKVGLGSLKDLARFAKDNFHFI